MRLSDLEKLEIKTKETEKSKNFGTREVNLTTQQLVNDLKMENSLAKEKIEKIPTQTKEELKPFFTEYFWKEGTA